jgi:hypothetical protein
MESTATSKPSYIYQPLKRPENIRLFFLAPGSGDDPLACHILQGPITAPPPYEALSYVWGNDEPRSTLQIYNCGIPLDGPIGDSVPSEALSSIRGADEEACASSNHGCGTKWITTNLEMALKRLRHLEKHRVLWADSICINQDDNSEKSVQVRKMRQIFAAAQRVDAYLGEESEYSQLVPKISLILRKTNITPDMYTHLLNHEYEQFGLPAHNDETWAAFRGFLRRPWFLRMWIIQEVVVARTLQLFCGIWEMPWDVFVAAMKRVLQIPAIMHDDDGDIQKAAMRSKGFGSALLLISLRLATQSGGHIDLLDVLLYTKAFRATRARDRLFALLGVASNTGDRLLDPDYDQPFKAVVERYARYFVEKYPNPMSMLCFAGRIPMKDDSFPSWMLDFTDGIAPRSETSHSSSRGPSSIYNTATESKARMKLGGSSQVLIVTGAITDSLAIVAKRRAFYYKELILQSDELLATLSSYPTGEDITDVQWRTLIGNQSAESGVAPASYRESYLAYREAMLEHKHREVIPEFSPFDVLGAPISETLANPVPYGRALDRMGWFSPCITKKGYFGLVPPGTEPGDVIFIALGAPIPLILGECNEKSGHYRLYGNAYIHGIMNGEALKEKDFQVDDIRLI